MSEMHRWEINPEIVEMDCEAAFKEAGALCFDDRLSVAQRAKFDFLPRFLGRLELELSVGQAEAVSQKFVLQLKALRKGLTYVFDKDETPGVMETSGPLVFDFSDIKWPDQDGRLLSDQHQTVTVAFEAFAQFEFDPGAGIVDAVSQTVSIKLGTFDRDGYLVKD